MLRPSMHPHRLLAGPPSLVYLLAMSSAIALASEASGAAAIRRQAKETITPIELNQGETLEFVRRDGSVLALELQATSATVLYTNKHAIPPDESGNDRGNMYRARLMYEFTCDIKVNGQPMTLRRYVSAQQSFYEPYVIDGVRLWFDGVIDIFEQHGGFLNTARGANGKPNKQARFLLQEMTSRICPAPLHAWFKDGPERNDNFLYRENFIDIGRCFNGDDCFLGAYLGGESHGALDIDMAMDSTIYAPFDLDDQSSIRIQGRKRWPDGSEWRIDNGHLGEKFVPDHVPIKGGEPYGRGARRACWWHPHSHFGFQIFESEILYDVDPWIVFWQNFEDNKAADGALRANMAPLSHSSTGEEIEFRSISPETGEAASIQKQYWTFGDGGWAAGPNPRHAYARAGVYPVTLTIDNGKELASFTQHITISGQDLAQPVLAMAAPDEPSFRPRPADAMDVYGWPPKFVPHTLEFLARPSRPAPNPRHIEARNLGGGTLGRISWDVDYEGGGGWLALSAEGDGDAQTLAVAANGQGLPAGRYSAFVSARVDGALNSPQRFRVVLDVLEQSPKTPGVIIDDSDAQCYITPYFWIGHRFHGWGWPDLKETEGYNHFYLINGCRDRADEFARFTPDLESGEYEVWLYERTPFASGPPANNEPCRFQVRVRHADGESLIWLEPQRMEGFFPRPYRNEQGWRWNERQISRLIGTFRFEEGADGFAEILAEGSSGQVIVDAMRFLKKDH